jgi:hypothetical protein
VYPAAPGRFPARRTRPRGLGSRDDQAVVTVIHEANYRL